MNAAGFYPDKFATAPHREPRDFTARDVDVWAEWLADLVARTDTGSRNLPASTLNCTEWSTT